MHDDPPLNSSSLFSLTPSHEHHKQASEPCVHSRSVFAQLTHCTHTQHARTHSTHTRHARTARTHSTHAHTARTHSTHTRHDTHTLHVHTGRTHCTLKHNRLLEYARLRSKRKQGKVGLAPQFEAYVGKPESNRKQRPRASDLQPFSLVSLPRRSHRVCPSDPQIYEI